MVLPAAIEREHSGKVMSFARAEYLHGCELGIPTPMSICAAVCDVYGVNQNQLTTKDRHKTIAEARQVAMFFMRQVLRLSYPEIGRRMYRDHTSVISGFRSITRKRDTDDLVRVRMSAVADKLLEQTPKRR